MAEQFLVAWAIDHDALFAKVGSNDAAFTKKALKNVDKVEELDEIFDEDETTAKEVLAEFMSGKLDGERAAEYRRLLELVAPQVGKRAGEDIILPGRGWQDASIVSWMKKAKLPKLATIWSTIAPFPWTKAKAPKKAFTTFDWPRLRFVPRKDHAALLKELGAFKIDKAPPLPKRQSGLEEEAELLVKDFAGWLRKAKGTDLVVLHDGQQ